MYDYNDYYAALDERIAMRIYVGEFSQTPQIDWTEDEFESVMRGYHTR